MASYPKKGRYVVGVFRDAGAFRHALDDLLDRGFDRAAISVLAEHSLVADHFGGRIPDAAEMVDRPDTPREDLDTAGALAAAIRFLAEGASVIGVVGAAAMAFAVGGPVGVATGTGAATEARLEGALTGYVDAGYMARYERSVRDGGVICWVHAYSAREAGAARMAMADHGGEDVHQMDLP